jgi:hypothetical protein
VALQALVQVFEQYIQQMILNWWKSVYVKASILSIILLVSCARTQTISEFDNVDSEQTSSKEKPSTQVEYFKENSLRFENHRYVESIKTVQMYRTGDPISDPVIGLSQGQALELHFDELGTDLENYYYRLYHCNADWQQSDLLSTEYIQGFLSDAITNYEYSFNTLRQYIHYTVSVPNANMKITKSGNYLLAVMRDDDEEQLVLTHRFMVVDNRVAIQPNVRQTAVVAERDFKQLIDFEVHYASFDIANPFRDIKTVIMQNQRWDNAISDLQPVFLRDKILEYRYEDGNDFWGGNEYRVFNVSSVRAATDRIKNIRQMDDYWYVNLATDYKRNLKNHFTWQDINGNYLIKTNDGYDDLTESDYVDVHFELAMDSPIDFGGVYIFGALSGRKTDKDFQMTYNYEEKKYECTVPLKQGYYEYQYVVLMDKTREVDFLTIEGSHYETDNEYTILIYYRDIRNDYDELIGVRSFSSLDFF